MFFEQLVKVGGHLGHAPRSWHPKMAPYILESRDGVHILDLVQSYAYSNQVKQFLSRAKKQNSTFLFAVKMITITIVVRQTDVDFAMISELLQLSFSII